MMKTLTIFCRVVDNYGDIGICWRIARQFAHEHDLQVQLWVDDLISFRRICPEVNTEAADQMVQDVRVRHWAHQALEFADEDISDVVIEFFACDIPPAYIPMMVQRQPQPVWINLEGLTAEDWVEGCHTLPSPHPQFPITKYFFFPGFNQRTGGLIYEPALKPARERFLLDQSDRDFLRSLGASDDELAMFRVSLFCYPHAPVTEMLQAFAGGEREVLCFVPEGVASDAVTAFCGQALQAGDCIRQGALTLRCLPFIPQTDYDKLLWSCDLNLVRGEDSFVRAQLAGKPFLWHIYPQDNNLHHKKLKAFLQIYCPQHPLLREMMLGWNHASAQVPDWSVLWPQLLQTFPAMQASAEDWLQQIHDSGDMCSQLLLFCGSKTGNSGQK